MNKQTTKLQQKQQTNKQTNKQLGKCTILGNLLVLEQIVIAISSVLFVIFHTLL
jgi:hypothetical protein